MSSSLGNWWPTENVTHCCHLEGSTGTRYISFFVRLTCTTGIGVGFQPQPSDVSNNQDRLEKLKVIDGGKPQNNEN